MTKTRILGKRLLEGTPLADLVREEGNEGMLLQYDKVDNALKRFKLATDTPVETEGTRGLWIQGPPGTGKSRKARQISQNRFGEEPFTLEQSKWFDGYKDEQVIVIEDLDKYTAHSLGHQIKLWADRYPVKAEVKGGTIPLKHQILIVTSNFTIEEAFQADGEKATEMQTSKASVTVEAIKDRFIVKTLKKVKQAR